MRDFHAQGEGHQCVGHGHTEVVVEVGFQRFADARLHLFGEVGNGVGGGPAERVDQRQGIHVAVGGDVVDEVQEPAQLGACRIDGEEDDVEALLVGVPRRLHREVDCLLQWPLVPQLDDVLAAGDLDNNPLDAAVHGALDVGDHAARKGEDLRAELTLHDLPDRGLIGLGHGGHPRLDAVHAGFGELFRDPNLVVLGKHHSCLLLAIAQGDVMKGDLLGKLELRAYLLVKVVGTRKPAICHPRRLHFIDLLVTSVLRGAGPRSGGRGR